MRKIIRKLVISVLCVTLTLGNCALAVNASEPDYEVREENLNDDETTEETPQAEENTEEAEGETGTDDGSETSETTEGESSEENENRENEEQENEEATDSETDNNSQDEEELTEEELSEDEESDEEAEAISTEDSEEEDSDKDSKKEEEEETDLIINEEENDYAVSGSFVNGFPLPWDGKKYGVTVLSKYSGGGKHVSYLGTYVSGISDDVNMLMDISRSGIDGTPVYAVADGVVREAAYLSGNGNYVRIKHNDGSQSQYQHLKYTPKVSKGQTVTAGQIIGYVGSTGNSTGSHLHFEWSKHDPYCEYYSKGYVYTVSGSGAAVYPHTHAPIKSSTYDYVVNNGELTITGYKGSQTSSLAIPSSIDGYKVTAIGDRAFMNSAIESFSFPSTLRVIGEEAFKGCKNISWIGLGDTGLCEIKRYAFSYCDYLMGISLPNNISSIPSKSSGSIILESPNAYFMFMSDTKTQETLINGGYINGKTKKTYTISYKCMDGITNPNPSTYEENTEVTLKAPTRTGYSFGGWYTDSGYKSSIAKISKGTATNITLYAKWITNKYTINFNGNGGSGAVKSMSCLYGYYYYLYPNAFSKTGYTFAGWGTSANSGKVYSNEQLIRNLTLTNNGQITLYAQWSPARYTYRYNLNAGSDTSATTGGSLTGTYTVNDTVIFPKAYRAGYTFKGWYSNSKLTKKVTSIKKGSRGDRTIYAKWQKNKYKVVFKANGGSGKMATFKGTYSTGKKLPSCKFKRTGYVFKGWSTSPSGGVVYQNACDAAAFAKSTKAKKITLYAVWEPCYSGWYKTNG